jgi:Lamin Tail Domain/Secretion system C-terminal sorting domain/Family of unknown function (DUF5689)
MKKFYTLLFILLASLSFGQATDLYFSMYGEGSSNNKFLEIYNGTGSTVDLSNYSIELYSNGAATATNTEVFTAGTMIASGDVYVLYNSGSNATIISASDLASTTTFFNGDDAVVLKKSGTIIDMIGQVGVDPGTGWNVGSTSLGTLNHTMVRKLTVCSPNAVALSSFGTDDATSEWIVYASDAEWGQIGSHSGCSTAINFSITSPINSTIFSPETTSVSVNLSVSNFNVAASGGDGHIHYTINSGGVVMKYDTTPIVVPTTPGSYTVYAELVDNTHTPIVPAKNATVTFTVASYTNATDLAAVRAAGLNAWVNFTGEAFVSFTRTTRNQKYIQDATAGILIDDSAALITTPFVIGDGISGIKGQLLNFNGVMQFTPNQNATKSSTGNVITPQVVTLATLAANIDAFESQLVQINGLTFAAGDGTATFVVNTDYVINDPTASIFRTIFPTTEVDYIGALIPQGSKNITVLVSETSGVLKVVSRSLADTNLSVTQNSIAGLNMYPNPVKNGNLYITSNSSNAKTVAVYDILGKQVLNSKTSNNTVNVANLKGGSYIVKITEDGKTDTRKLIIE